MQKTNNIQEVFLTQVRRDRRPVTIFTMNGYQMRGYVTGLTPLLWCLAARASRWWCTNMPSPPSCPNGLSPFARRENWNNVYIRPGPYRPGTRKKEREQ